MAHAQHRVLVWGAHQPGRNSFREVSGRGGTGRPGADGIVVPALLALLAHNLVFFDPMRVLAWRWLHDPRLAEGLPAWLRALAPAPAPGWDRDPIAAVLAFFAVMCGGIYLVLARREGAIAARAVLLTAVTLVLVVLPSMALIEMGRITGRPYGQDGGVVQLPLAMDKILRGESPYRADYSDSILGKEARASGFWAQFGENPILRHHAYLPGTHLLVLPGYALSRVAGVPFDPRIVTLAAFIVAIGLAASIPASPPARLAAAACVAVNPLIHWHQIFGANDAIVLALLLGAMLCVIRDRRLAGAGLLGLACATKQLAWPFAPFLLVALAGMRGFGSLTNPVVLRRLAGAAIVALAVFAVVVAPVAGLDLRAFWGDIVAYNVGLPGADNYPLGGTPGFGFANFLIYFGAVNSLADYFPFAIFFLLLAPLGLFLLHRQLRSGEPAAALVTGSAALLASLYFSRVVHPNYLILLASALPVGVLACRRLAADTAVVPLALLSSAVAVVGGEVYRTTWEDAVAVRLPQWTTGLWSILMPRSGPQLTLDPLGIGLGGLAAGLALVYLVAAIGGASRLSRASMVAVCTVGLVALPALFLGRVSRASGTIRAQDSWTTVVAGSAHPVREAWSRSFQKGPPALLEVPPRQPRFGRSPLDRITAAASRLWARPSPVVDPRPVILLALAVGGWLLWRHSPREQVPLVLGAALLSPFTVLGVPFGSGEWIFLLVVVFAIWASRGWLAILPLLAAIPRGIAALPAVMPPFRQHAGFVVLRRLWALVPVPAFVLGWPLMRPAEATPEADWTAVMAYDGSMRGEAFIGDLLSATVVAVAVLLATWAIWKPWSAEERVGAVVLLLWLWTLFTPGATPAILLTPLVLLLLQCVSPANAGVVELADTHV